MTVHANIKTYNAAVARLGAAKILLLPISLQLSSVILSKILHSWHLVILLTIIFLHVAQFGDNEIAFPHNRPAEFRKFLGEHYIKPKNFLFGLLRWEEEAYNSRKERFVSVMNKTSQHHMVVDTIIATVTFTAGITMPRGFIGQEGPHSGSPVLMRSTAFKAFIITNTIAMVQSCSAAFFHLFMPLLFDEKKLGDFSFLLASLAFCASISSMGTMMVAFVLGTYAVLMHSWGLAVANSVIGLFYFIPVFFHMYRMSKLFHRNIESGFVLDFRLVELPLS